MTCTLKCHLFQKVHPDLSGQTTLCSALCQPLLVSHHSVDYNCDYCPYLYGAVALAGEKQEDRDHSASLIMAGSYLERGRHTGGPQEKSVG